MITGIIIFFVWYNREKKGRGRRMGKKNVIFKFFITMLLWLTFVQNPVFADSLKEVLIINSYHFGLSWTDESTRAEIETIKGKYGDDVRFYIEYMDWKEHPTMQSMDLFESMMYEKYNERTFELIIASDDAALAFVLEHRTSLFEGIPIVFHGVSESSFNDMAKEINGLTGILEIVDIRSTIEVALQVNPEMKTFYIVHDQTESGKAMGEAASEEIKRWFPELEAYIITNHTVDDIVEFAGTLTNKDSILMTAYYTDISGRNINFEDMVLKVSQSTEAAVFSLYDFAIGNGALGGNMLSAKMIGERAGEVANRILDGESPESIPLVRENIHLNAIDYEAAEKFGIDFERLSEDIMIINRPISKFELYREVIMVSVGVVSLLTVFLVILAYALKRTVKLKNELAEKNIEQKGLYDELAASEEELKAQFDALNDLYDQLQDSKAQSERISNEIRYAAYHDALTGFWNKTALEEKIQKDGATRFAILLVDIDHFKRINDTMGHVFGDRYIKAVGLILKKILDDKSKIFRINGDEFVIHYELESTELLDQFVNRLLNALNTVVSVEYSNFSNSVSIGYAIYPDDGESLEILLSRADLAMYKAKESGRGRAVKYDNSMVDHIIWRVEREEALKKALERQEFSLVYQPQIDCSTGEIIGFEALLRWYNAELGQIPPMTFIPIAEETQLIMPIGKWVVEEAAAFLAQIQQRYDKKMHMAVNVSVAQLIQEDFVKMIMDILEAHNINPEHFIIEITESVLMQAIEDTLDKLSALQKYGIKVSLDDFGTGYSSLSYLKTLPIDVLKIDKSFIDTLGDSKEQRDLVEIIVKLGKQLNMRMVAEGVEHPEQLDILRDIRCDAMQGYLYSKPIDALSCFKLLDIHYKN